MKKYSKLFILGLAIITLAGCGKVPVLKDGDEAVITSKEGDISVTDFYTQLKDKYGAAVVIDMIDKMLFDKMYESDDDEVAEVNTQIEDYKKQATDSSVTWDYWLSYYGFASESAFRETLVLNYRRTKAVDEYLAKQLTAKEIDDYYKNDIFGDVRCKHILIAPESLDGMTDAEKKKAETAALNEAKDLIKQLNDGADFDELAKKYSDDKTSAVKGGDVGWFNTGDMVEEFQKAAFALKKGKYTSSPVLSTHGYHIIYKTDEKAKPKLKDVETTIKETLVENKLTADSTLYYKTLIKVREENEIEIHDDEVKSAYNKRMNELTTQSSSN